MFDDVLLHCFLFLLFFWCACMAINNVNVQYNNGGLLPYIILLTQCYYHKETRLKAIKRFLYLFAAYDPVPKPSVLIFFPPD